MTGILTRATVAACAVTGLSALVPALACAGWTPAVDISPAGEYTFEEQPQIAVGGPGRAVAVWTQKEYIGRIQAASKQPNGTWGPPVDLTSSGSESFAPQVAMNEAGEAVVVWVHRGEKLTIETAAMTPQGTWTRTAGLSVPGGDLGNLDVAIDETGRSTAIWDHLDQSGGPSTYLIEAATRPPGGSWGEPHALTEDEYNAWDPSLAVDGLGRVVAAWAHYTDDGDHTYIEAAEMSPEGVWGEPEELSGRAGKPFGPKVAAGAERAVVVWTLGNLVEAAYRDSGGSWSGPVGVSGSEPEHPAVAMGPGGAALAVWSESQEGQIVKSATLPAGATSWTKPLEVSEPQPVEGAQPELAVDPAGDATAVWTGWDGEAKVIEAASGSVGGGWHEPAVISSPEVWSDRPQVGMDGSGDAAAVWRGLAKSQTIQAGVLDVTGPELDPVSFPATGRAGTPLSFAASPFDSWSPTGQVSWAFGDGSVGTGANVSHAYPAAGRFQVTAAVTDATGLLKTVSGMVEVSPALAVADRVVTVRKGNARLTLRCPGTAECQGRAELSARVAKGMRRNRIRSIAATAFAVPAGDEASVTARLSRWSLKRLATSNTHRLAARLTGDAVAPRSVVLRPISKQKHR